MFNKPQFWDKKISLISIILYPLSFLFFILSKFRKIVIRPIKFNIPIICVGNIYIGGTGKTPTSIFLAEEFFKKGKKPVIVRKYYKRHADEHDLIKENFSNLILCKNRKEGIQEAKKKLHDIVILDDGFQDYTIKKDLNIVCFNQNQLIGNGFLIPSGPLRENLHSLNDADIIIINGKKDEEFEKKILKININLKIFYSIYKPLNIDQFKNHKILALAGIANPTNFFQLLKNNDLKIEKRLSFPDHHIFKKNEIQKIVEEANNKNYQILMTEKDFFKVKEFNFKEIKYLKVSLEILEKERLIKSISNIYDKKN